MRIYIAGPMQGIPYFNFPEFLTAQKELEELGHIVFNPAERINQFHGTDISVGNDTGNADIAVALHGFDIGKAMAENLRWICLEANAVYVLKGWEDSKGSIAEIAAMEARGGRVSYEDRDLRPSIRELVELGLWG